MTSTLDSIAADVTRQHGDKADVSGIAAAAHFLPFYRTGTRIRVETTYGTGPDAETYTRTGDRIVAVQHGRTYREDVTL